MRRFVCALSLAAVLGATAGAITYGVPDGNDHPNVGLLIAVIPEGAFAICSGVLVSPTVFLTAGHCTDFLDELNAQTFVSFNSSAPFGPFVPGTPHTHPDFDLTLPDTGTSGPVRPGGRRAFRTATVYRVCIRSPGLEDGRRFAQVEARFAQMDARFAQVEARSS